MKTLSQLMKMKHEQTKLSMVTAYDFPSAKQAQQADIDMILVGDSLGMTVLGYESTVQVTIEDMIHHGKAVRRGAPDTFVVVDMPIGTVGLSDEDDLKHALRLYQETQANALKVEGAHLVSFIQKATRMGIPIVSHLGLTPQSVGVMGYKLQGGTKEAAIQLIEDAKAMEEAGAVLLVLEAIPSDLAQVITEKLTIPVIGVDLGARRIIQKTNFSIGIEGLKQYNDEVKNGTFPSEQHTYKKKIMDEVETND